MRRVGWCGLVLALALPAAPAQDPPEDDKKPPRERYDSLAKGIAAEREKIIADYQKAKGEEQQKLLDRYYALGKEYAEKFYQLAEDAPNDPAAADALFWVVQNGSGSPAYKKATDKVVGLVGDMPLKDLNRRLNGLRSAPPAVLDAALKRAEKDESDAAAGDVLAWVATTGSFQPAGPKAVERLVEKYPDHAALERVCATLARSPSAGDTLKKILEKADKPRVKAAAAMALGQSLVARTESPGNDPKETEKAGAEAEKYLAMAADLYGKADAAPQKQAAERELKAFQTLRVGKEAPEIKGPDLDGKEFKLSDYRGKVVLLDFWGDW